MFVTKLYYVMFCLDSWFISPIAFVEVCPYTQVCLCWCVCVCDVCVCVCVCVCMCVCTTARLYASFASTSTNQITIISYGIKYPKIFNTKKLTHLCITFQVMQYYFLKSYPDIYKRFSQWLSKSGITNQMF